MAEAAWRVRLRQGVAEAAWRVDEADAALKLLHHLYPVPVSAIVQAPAGLDAWAAAFRSKLSLALRWITGAAQLLDAAVGYMEAAETRALHEGNVANPSVPLPSIMHLDLHAAAALSSLQTARGMAAAEACRFVGLYRGHVSTAIALVDAPGIPNSLVHAQREYDTALGALINAILWTNTVLGEVSDAVYFIAPP